MVALSIGMLEQAWVAMSTQEWHPRPLLLHPAQYEDLERRYAWQAENPTHDIWDGYNWNHGMKEQVRARGLAMRRKRRAFLRSRAASR